MTCKICEEGKRRNIMPPYHAYCSSFLTKKELEEIDIETHKAHGIGGSEKMEPKKAEQSIEEPNSVKIAINKDGKYSGEVKCYAATIEDAMIKATEKAKELEIIIQEKNG